MKYIGTYKESLETMKKGKIKNTVEKERDMYKAIRKKGDNKNREEAENKERVDNKG